MLMFTTLVGGLCAFVIESNEHTKEANTTRSTITAVASYPAVAIGVVAPEGCRVNLTLITEVKTPGLIVGKQAHSFHVKIGETSATLWIDDQPFTIPRAHAY
jgi:hypothetical protein